MFRLVLVGLLSSFISTQAEARTIRYEFDVVGSSISYDWLDKYDPYDPFAYSTVSGPEYAGFTARYHAVGEALGKTGSVALEVETYDLWGKLSCVSGFLCATTALSRPIYEIDWPYYSDILSGFSPGPSGYQWYLSTGPSGLGTLGFFDDGGFSGFDDWNGASYYWRGARATFALANLSITDVTPAPALVPLPAGAPLLAAGLLALGIGARWRRRPAITQSRFPAAP